MLTSIRLCKFLTMLLTAACFALATVAPAMAMDFKIKPRTQLNEMSRITIHGGRFHIFASGAITEDSADALTEFVAREKIELARVYFDSPGGSLIGGIRLGERIRSLGFETSVQAIDYEYEKGPKAICASACAYAFAGGTHRFLGADSGEIGLHQFFSTTAEGLGSGDTQRISALILDYLSRMGLDAQAFKIASQTHSGTMAWLTSKDAELIGLVDNGVAPPTAQIKLRDGWPYLRLEQHFNDVSSRVLLMCVETEFYIMAGIVTNPEVSNQQVGFFGTSYLYFDEHQYMPVGESRGHKVEGSVVWLERPLTPEGLSHLASAETLGIWLNNGGPMQWGSHMDISKVRTDIDEFVKNCRR